MQELSKGEKDEETGKKTTVEKTLTISRKKGGYAGFIDGVKSNRAQRVVQGFTDRDLGEVGLSGEVRAVSQAQLRVQEAAKMGFTSCVLPRSSMRRLEAPEGMKLIPVGSLAELSEIL